MQREYAYSVWAAVAVLIWAVLAQAQIVAIYDEAVGPPAHGVFAYVLGDFAAPGVVTATPDSLVFDVTPNPNTVPHGRGVVYSPRINFVASQHEWDIRLRVLAENNAAGFLLGYDDHDGLLESDPDVENWVFRFDLSPYSPADGWVTLRQGFGAPVAYVPLLPGPMLDMVQNPGLQNIFLFAEPTSAKRLHIELDYIRIRAVPEPQTCGLLLTGIAASTLVGGRRARRQRGEMPPIAERNG
jgi:hypothetical protein